MSTRPKRRGFTLIELMMVVAIIGLLSAIALPKFSDLIIRSREAALKGKLGNFRSALSIYYANTEGVFPFLNSLSNGLPGYLDAIPNADVPKQDESHSGKIFTSALVDAGSIPGMAVNWYYSSLTGELRISCSHLDSRGTIWSVY